jgi:type VI secretion system protein ImpJ
MQTRQVRWHDGMLVLPHHFQALDDNFRDLVTSTIDSLIPSAYGLRTFSISEESLANYEIRIRRLEARLKDGTIVSVPDVEQLPVLNVRNAFSECDRPMVFLLLPQVVSGRPNSAPSREMVSSQHRFATVVEQRDEINTGENRREIELQEFNLQLKALPSFETPAGFEALPLMRLRRSSQPGATPEIDTSYVPPVLASESFAGLRHGILQNMYAQLGAFIKRQAADLVARGGWLEANSPDVSRLIAQLTAANSSYPVIFQLIHQSGVHPFNVYLEFCRLIGQLAIFREDLEAPILPSYDHDRIADVFDALSSQLDSVFQSSQFGGQISRRPFVGTIARIEVALESDWLQPGHELYIGIGSELPADTLDQLFANSHLDWKLASVQAIEDVYRNAESGLAVHRFTGGGSMLPTLSNVTYFRIDRTGLYWRQLLDSPALAIKINESFTRGSYTGQNAVTVVDLEEVEHQLSFDLFVVKNG